MEHNKLRDRLRRMDWERFEAKYIPVPESGCWLWMGAGNGNGYGQFWHQGRMRPAHRIAYEYCVGIVPSGLFIDHLCRVRCCVNPDHMEAVTNKENVLRGDGLTARHKRKTHCPYGHPYDEKNTYCYSSGKRECRVCNMLRSRQYRLSKRLVK